MENEVPTNHINKTAIPIANAERRAFMVHMPIDSVEHAKASCMAAVRQELGSDFHLSIAQCVWTGHVNASDLRVSVEIGRTGANA